jgi:hypothetical protein
MSQQFVQLQLQQRRIRPSKLLAPLGLFSVLAAWSPLSYSLDYGPFSLTGFAKLEVVSGSHQCPDCQRFPGEDKQRLWADELVAGRPYGTKTQTLSLFQPYLGAKFDLGKGFKLEGLLSQRWRDGKEDIPGFLYERNVSLSHEDYGSVRFGAMPTRSWALADFPYGTNVNVADSWASSGAGYGLLTRGLRFTTRPLEVFSGDLVLEATTARGDSGFTVNKPRFLELYGQYHKGDWFLDGIYQNTRNGNPQAWGHGPFTGLTPFSSDDSKLGGSGQSISMLMSRYQYNPKLELQGGLRHNRWSGAYAVITNPASPAQWNNMFNVDWNGSLNGVSNPGYAATSRDLMLGMRYRMDKWVVSTGLVHLGKATTANPSERGQSNSATINTVGVNYEFGHGLSFYGFAGMVNYRRLGLSPMSMPSNSAFTNVDSRVKRSGNWGGIGVVYVY